MGVGTSMVIALLLVGFILAAISVYSSVYYYQKLVQKAQNTQETMKKAKMQTSITITNVTNQTTSLNISLQNIGETTLNASLLEIFVNGTYYPSYTLYSGNTWAPMNYSNITVAVAARSGNRIKVVTENGISAYVLSP